MNKDSVEIERKYIIKMPDFSVLEKQEDYSSDCIVQTYLASKANVTHRVRRRVGKAGTVYTETVKMRIDAISAFEDEREISESEYLEKVKNIAPQSTPVEKVRHSFTYLGQLFEIDVYPRWVNIAVMETELPSRDTAVTFPDFISIVKEVTGDKRYSNASLSRAFPREDEVTGSPSTQGKS